MADQSFLLLEREEKIAELSTELDSLKEQVCENTTKTAED